MDLCEIGGRFMILSILNRRQMAGRATGYELYPGQLQLLDAVMLHPGIPQQDVASRLGVSPASIAQSVKRLERAGLVEKHADQRNLRRNQLFATSAGIDAANQYRECFDEINQMMFDHFSEEDLSALAGYLDRMIENLRMDDFDLEHFPIPMKPERKRKHD